MSKTSRDREPAVLPPQRADPPWTQVGLHRIRVVDDCVERVIDGPMTLEQVQAFERVQLPIHEQYEYALTLSDCHKAAGMSADARRYVAQQARLHPERIYFSALYGCSTLTIAVSTLVMRAITLISGKPQYLEICRDEASARERLAAFRASWQRDKARPRTS